MLFYFSFDAFETKKNQHFLDFQWCFIWNDVRESS